MTGKIIKLNDYKFTYGAGSVYLNVYAAFKTKKGGNKYLIYSYDNVKLYMGSLFIRDNEIVVMELKEENKKDIHDFVTLLLENKSLDEYEIISLDNITSVQVIEESVYTEKVDVSKINDLTIPKPVVEEENQDTKSKKKFSIAYLFFGLFIIVVIAFFFFNPEVINGKDRKYVCSKSYKHDKVSVNVNEEVKLLFSGNGTIKNMNMEYEYIFDDADYYSEFKSNNYEYKYFKVNATYRHNDSLSYDDYDYTCKLFSEVFVNDDGYFMPRELDELISYYQDKGYECKEVEIE